MRIFRSSLSVLALAGASLLYSQKAEKPQEVPIPKNAVTVEQSTVSSTHLAFPGEEIISEAMLRKDLEFLASDENRGRQAGDKILETRVTNYLEDIFIELGLEKPFGRGTSYRQPFIIDWEDIPWEEGKFDKKPLKPSNENKPRMKSVWYRDRIAKLYAEFPEEGLSRRPIKTHNLAAIIEGTDEKLKDEYIILCAHMDHIGIDQLAEPDKDFVFNGADDNGSGVSAALANVRAFVQAIKKGNGPKRSIIILLPTAEEMGLLGSEFFVNNPPVNLKQIKGVINIDMLGRNAPDTFSILDSELVPKTKDEDEEKLVPNFFHNEHDALLSSLGIKHLVHDLEDSRWYSDQWNFIQAGIPTIFIHEGNPQDSTSGKHAHHKEYHTVGDEVGLIDFGKLLQGARLVFRMANIAADKEF